MPSASMGIELISEPFLIPVWFYSYSAIVYAASALISIFVTYFSYKFFMMSKTKSAIILMFSFLFLTIAFSTLTFTSLYTYLYKPYFKHSLDIGSLSFVNNAGFNLYYIASIIAYVSLLIMYLPKDIKKFLKNKMHMQIPVLYVPLWYLELMNFHIASILILAYVVVRNVVNFCKKKDVNNFLVMFAFISIVSFHASLLFTTFDPTIYIAANTLLATGFGSLLLMLIRVSRSGRKRSRNKTDRKKSRKKV